MRARFDLLALTIAAALAAGCTTDGTGTDDPSHSPATTPTDGVTATPTAEPTETSDATVTEPGATPTATDAPVPTPTATATALTCNTDWEDAGPSNRSSSEEHKDANMYPGADCIQCHTTGGVANQRTVQENKTWTLAGTLFADPLGHGPLSGAKVEVTDATGKVVTMTSNSAGNFYTTTAVTFPIAGKVSKGSASREMFNHPDSGSCNTCHLCGGQAGAKLYLSTN